MIYLLIICFVIEASREIGISKSCIAEVCRGEREKSSDFFGDISKQKLRVSIISTLFYVQFQSCFGVEK